jgi:micrococcal nuclease
LSPPIQIEFSVKKENTKKTVWDPDDPQCIGDALCLSETIVRIVDGDTLYLKGGYEVRLSLTNTPERYELGFHNANQFTAKICPVTMTAVFDQDDGQPYDVYGRLIGKITCNGNVLNSELLYAGHANILKQYCSTSEFSDESWAKEFGC